MLSCSNVVPRAGEDDDAIARRLARQFHEDSFAPRVNLTQSDIRSLDGSTTVAAGHSAEKVRDVLNLVGVPE